MKILKRVLLILLIIVILTAGILYLLLRSTLPQLKGEIIVSKYLRGKVIIKRNHYGIPLIEANSFHDVLFATGFLHASDRLFQMELSRRNAIGKLSKIFGERALSHDKNQKRLMIEESIQKDLEKIPAPLNKLIQSYCQGVNFYIKNNQLPPEFKLLGFKPVPWEIKDTLAILKNMQITLEGSGFELGNLNLIRAFTEERSRIFRTGEHNYYTIIKEDEIDRAFENEDLLSFLHQERQVSELNIGSNNWVISGSKTKSKQPILANDPHLPNIFPSYFYQIKALFRDMELSGNTMPGVPFVIIGRNKNITWGFTNLGTDVIDYGILKINPNNKNQYMVDGNWIDFEIISKTIPVKKKEDVIIKVKNSMFGPVVTRNNLVMVRHALFLYPTNTLEAFYRMNLAQDINTFIKGLKLFSAPGQNVVFADKKGNIGYYPTGLVPKRRIGDGSLPLQITDSKGLWEGFYDEEEKPVMINPQKGYIITANNPVMPGEKIPVFAKTWYPYFRAERIFEMIQGKENISLKDVKDMQCDSFLKNAEFLLDSIRGFIIADPQAKEVFDILMNWDLRADKGIAPALFYHFESHLTKVIFIDNLRDKKYQGSLFNGLIYRLLNYPNLDQGNEGLAFFADDRNTPEQETYFDMVVRALKKTKKLNFENNNEIQWENVHTLKYSHPLGSVSILGFLNRGSYYIPGGKGSVLANGFSYSRSFAVNFLPTFRMIVDLSDFSNSLQVNSSGQSGHFMSPYYADQIPLYVNLQYRKMEDFNRNLRKLVLIPEK